MYKSIKANSTAPVKSSKLLIYSGLVALLLIRASFACPPNDNSDVLAAESTAFPSTAMLTVVKDKVDTSSSSHASYALGSIDRLDDAQDSRDFQDSVDLKSVLPGIKHVFQLKNKSKEPLTIDNFRASCTCIQARVHGTDYLREFPYTVKPGAMVSVVVAIDQHAIAPGPFSITTTLVRADGATSLASLTLTGNFKTGIEFSPAAVKFGNVPAGQTKSCFVTLSLNHKISLHLPPGAALQVVTNNTNLKVSSAVLNNSKSGVKVVGDTIILPKHEMTEDTKIRFRVELQKNAPLGALGGKVRLIVPDFPVFLFVDNAKVPVSGFVTGHMKLASDPSLVLGTVLKGAGAVGSTDILCTSTAIAKSLNVVTKNKYLSTRLVPVASAATDSSPKPAGISGDKEEQRPAQSQLGHSPNSDGTKPLPSSTVRLEVSLDSQAPVGKLDTKIIVTNSISGERLEIPVYLTVAESRG